MKKVTLTRDEFITASGVTDEGSIRFVQRQFPEVVSVEVEDSAIEDVVAEEAAPAEAPVAEEVTPQEENTEAPAEEAAPAAESGV